MTKFIKVKRDVKGPNKNPVYIQINKIDSVGYDKDTIDKRYNLTRIETDNRILLVTETPSEVMVLIQSAEESNGRNNDRTGVR